MKTVVIVFGRFNPPTRGHEKLFSVAKEIAKKERADLFVYSSHNKDKKNPLSYTQKMFWLNLLFPEMQKNLVISSEKDILDIAIKYTYTYEKFILVSGDDRQKEFNALLWKYNGKPTDKGIYAYRHIHVVSAGERCPDSSGVEGISATKLREAAIKDDFETFSMGAAGNENDKQMLFSAVREGLNIMNENIS